MSDWIITPATGPLGFPVARHRHPNGTMDAVRDRTPSVVQPLGGVRSERWTYACPCGDVYTWDRPRAGGEDRRPVRGDAGQDESPGPGAGG